MLPRVSRTSVPLVVLLLTAMAMALLALFTSAAFAGEDGTEEATEEETEEGATITGTIADQGEGVEGVEIVARDSDGEEVGSATTDADGAWTIEVPGPGRYEVELIEESLPDEVELRDPDRNPVSVRILNAGGSSRAIFAIGEAEGGGRLFRTILQRTVLGLRFGLIIAMTAVGLSLIFGTTGLINFAHGDVVTMGAVIAWFLSTGEGLSIHLVPAALLAVGITAAFSGALEIGMFRPLRKRQVGLFQLLIITIGLALVLRHVVLYFFGASPKPYRHFTVSRAVEFGPIQMPPRDLVIMALSVLLLVGVATMLQKTRIGKAMRAVSDNRDLAESSGIDVNRVVLFVWVLGGALAAVGGVFYGSSITVDYLMGFQLLLLMFAGVILGGLGTAYGAMVGSIVVGIVTEVSTVWFASELKFMWGLFILIVVLLFRPQGILGRKERVG